MSSSSSSSAAEGGLCGWVKGTGSTGPGSSREKRGAASQQSALVAGAAVAKKTMHASLTTRVSATEELYQEAILRMAWEAVAAKKS